jgi:hypothetical protein
MASDLKNLYL